MSEEGIEMGELLIHQTWAGHYQNEYSVFAFGDDGMVCVAEAVALSGSNEIDVIPKNAAHLSIAELKDLRKRLATLNEWPKASLFVRRRRR